MKKTYLKGLFSIFLVTVVAILAYYFLYSAISVAMSYNLKYEDIVNKEYFNNKNSLSFVFEVEHLCIDSNGEIYEVKIENGSLYLDEKYELIIFNSDVLFLLGEDLIFVSS